MPKIFKKITVMGSKGGDLSKCSFELPWGHTKPQQRVWSCSVPFGLVVPAAYCDAVLHFPCSIAFSMQYCSFGVGISDSTALSQAFAYLTY